MRRFQCILAALHILPMNPFHVLVASLALTTASFAQTCTATTVGAGCGGTLNIQFTPQGGEISIKVGWTATGGQYVSVTDTGPGIPEEEIPIVLQTFGRGSLAIKTAEQGSGLGLPIVKGLIDLHKGGFHLKSKLRAGTEVTITLPAERVMDTLAALPEPATRSAA